MMTMARSSESPVKEIVLSGKLTVCELENGRVEIVDLPSYKMVMSHSYVNVYQRA